MILSVSVRSITRRSRPIPTPEVGGIPYYMERRNCSSIRWALSLPASLYFSCLKQIIPFKERDPKSEDIFNICLNYGYGILYSEIERACILSGLDPYLGFLHVDRYGKPSMVLDLVEQFRPIIDRAIINLFVRKQISDKDLETIGEGILLTKDGRTKKLTKS